MIKINEESVVIVNPLNVKPGIVIKYPDNISPESVKKHILTNEKIVDLLLMCYEGAKEKERVYMELMTKDPFNPSWAIRFAEASSVKFLLLEIFHGEENIQRMLLGGEYE